MKKRIEKVKEWIETHPNETIVIVTIVAVGTQVVYTAFGIRDGLVRQAEIKRYRRAFENAVASGKDIRLLPTGTTEIINIKK